MMNQRHYVGLGRRLLAYTLDIFVFWSLIAISFELYPDHYAFFSNDEEVSAVLFIESTVLLLYILDQVLGPVLFGRTITRWICGYRIEQHNGDNPTIWQSLLRFFSLIFIEVITIGLVTFITTLVRKDKAALHDLISRTNAVYPTSGTPLIKTRFTLALSSITLTLLYIVVSLTYIVYEEITMPEEISAEENGIFPERIIRTNNNIEKTVTVGGVDLLNVIDYANTTLCEKTNSDIQKIYSLKTAESEFTIEYRHNLEQLFMLYNPETVLESNKIAADDDFMATTAKKIVQTIKHYPFLPENHHMAAWVTEYDDPQFSLFTPMENIAYMIGKVSFAISFPTISKKYSVKTYSVIHDDYYGYLVKVTAKKIAHMDIYLVNGKNVWRIVMYSPPNKATAGQQVLADIIDSIQPSRSPRTTIDRCS